MKRKVSAHEIHYTANRAVAEEMRRKTFLPYKSGLLGGGSPSSNMFDECVAHLLDDLFQGYNGTVIAYRQPLRAYRCIDFNCSIDLDGDTSHPLLNTSRIQFSKNKEKDGKRLNPGNSLYISGLYTRPTHDELEEHFSKEGK
ncbi:hypothetical protein Ccrd_025744, partial [Cynara cardunculus var. scolymus]